MYILQFVHFYLYKKNEILYFCSKGKSEKPVTSEDLSKLPYLTRVVKEALRIIPSVQAVDRELHQDIVLGMELFIDTL